jgi:four helix bundle protein
MTSLIKKIIMEKQSKPTKLEDIQVYQRAMEIGEEVWLVVENWEYFNKKTIGEQWVRAIDSVAANISEGYGRYFYKENKNFCRYARGSLTESKTWLQKAYTRKLVTQEIYEKQYQKLGELHFMLNAYIKSIGNK